MSKTNTFESDILKLAFCGTTITGLSGITTLWLSLHTGTGGPGEAGNQTTNETAYGGYTRKSIARTTTGWTVTTSNSTAKPAANLDFPSCTSGTATITFAGIGTASTGNGYLMYKGAVSPTISVSAGVIPRLTNTSAITED